MTLDRSFDGVTVTRRAGVVTVSTRRDSHAPATGRRDAVTTEPVTDHATERRTASRTGVTDTQSSAVTQRRTSNACHVVTSQVNTLSRHRDTPTSHAVRSTASRDTRPPHTTPRRTQPMPKFSAIELTGHDYMDVLGKLQRWTETRPVATSLVSVTFSGDHRDGIHAVALHTGSERESAVPIKVEIDSGDELAINPNLARRYGKKSAYALTVWLASIQHGTPYSTRTVDRIVGGNGVTKVAIRRYIADYGDPRNQPRRSR